MNPSKIEFSKLQNEAIQFALQAHWTQRRKGTVLPYIIHPIETAGYLGKLYPHNHDLIIAGYLHDVLEDTSVQEHHMRERFGDRVLELVLGVTSIGQWPTWRNKRQSQLDKIETATDLDIVRLKAADMLSNATSIAFDVFREGEWAFDKFKGSRDDVIWYYSSATRIFVERIPNEDICDLLSNQVEAFDRFWERL